MKPASVVPAYAALYPLFAEAAREKGYALTIHGTLGRDMDLVAIPWIEDPAEPFETVVHIANVVRAVITEPENKFHGRMAYSLCLGDGGVIDLSIFAPRRRQIRIENERT